jgi:HD-like signal output (HDOD) protein
MVVGGNVRPDAGLGPEGETPGGNNVESTSSDVAVRLSAIQDLSTIPPVAAKIVQLCGKPDTDMGEVADLLLSDQVLASKVLRLIRSAFYGISREDVSLREAIVFLGLKKVSQVVLATSLINRFDPQNRLLDLSQFWIHGFGTALVSKLIAERVDLDDTESAYMAGLLHDLGVVVMSQHLKDDFEKVAHRVREERCSIHAAEEQVLDYSHAEVGAYVAENWGLSEELVAAIRWHHDPQKAGEHKIVAAIVSLADLLCRVRGMGLVDERYLKVCFAEHPGWQILAEEQGGIERVELGRFSFEIDEQMDGVIDLAETLFAA